MSAALDRVPNDQRVVGSAVSDWVSDQGSASKSMLYV
jgi:hypothetical protein